MSEDVVVDVGGPSPYRIDIGNGLLGDSERLAERWRGRHALIVSDSHVAPLYADALLQTLRATSASGSRPAGTVTGKPSRWRSACKRAASISLANPIRADRRAASTMPIATASPCTSPP